MNEATKKKRIKKAEPTVTQAVASGDRLAILQALRRKVAEEIEAAPPKELPALARELRLLTAQIAPGKQEGSVVDEIAARRTARRAKAKARARS